MDGKKQAYRIWKMLMKSVEDGTLPQGYYGPKTCRWATSEEAESLGLTDIPLVHFNVDGQIDCAITENSVIRVNDIPSIPNGLN
jgi:hypothetical protein